MVSEAWYTIMSPLQSRDILTPGWDARIALGRDKQTAPWKENSDLRTQEILVCRIRNPRNFCLWNPESWALESSRNRACWSRNATSDWSSESKWHWQRIGIHYPESGIHGVESRIHNCLGFPYMGETKERNILNDILGSLFASRLSLRFCIT